MKLKTLNIASFGGIKNLELNLNDGFNVILGDNEHGKTTVMSFIKMMFYGTERSSAQLNKNPRKKYTPWDNGLMAGSITFEQGGRDYKLERIFGSSNSTDKVNLFDLSLGTSQAVTADIGTKLFGLSLPAFERSLFIGQFGFPESNSIASGELNGKLSNIALTGDEAISFDAVNKRLETARLELMSKSGRAGLYDKNLKLYSNLEDELKKAQSSEEIIKRANLKVAEISDNIKAATQKAKLLKSQIDAENDFRNLEKLKELLDLKTSLDELNLSLKLNDGKLADEMFVRKVEFCLSKIQNIESRILAKQNENQLIENNLNLALNAGGNATPEKQVKLTEKIAGLEAEKSSVAQKISLLEQEPAKKSFALWYILAVIFASLGVAGYFALTQPLALLGVGLAVIFVCMALIGNSKAKTKADKIKSELVDLKLKENQIVSLIATESANLNAITLALNTNSAMIESQKELLKTNNAEIEALAFENKAEEQILFNLFASYRQTENTQEIKALLEDIKQAAQAQKELKQNINYILKDVGNLSYDEIREKLSSVKASPDIDFNAIKSEYDALLQSITAYKTEAATILAEIKSLSANAKNPDTIKAEMTTLKEKITSQKEYCDSLAIALEVLTDSYAEVRQSYGSALEKKAGEIFNHLTGGNYRNMSISKSFDIAVEKTDVFGTKELDYLSSGTVDQAYLSLRLALSSLISEETEGLPIILDDVLAQYDDNRTKTALGFLKEYSDKGQIILFTCHKAVTDMAKEFDANQITL